MTSKRLWGIYALISLATVCTAAETNILSFAYAASIPAHASTPDTWLRRLNDGYWAGGLSDCMRYDGDVAFTLDLARHMQVERVTVRTGASPAAPALGTQGASLEGSADGLAWVPLGALEDAGSGVLTLSPKIFALLSHLRVTCARAPGADGQAFAEITVEGVPALPRALANFTYTYSMPVNPSHNDNSFSHMKNGQWSASNNQSVQFGPNDTTMLDTTNPTNSIASNVVVTANLGSVKTVRSAHLYAYNISGNTYGTGRVTLSNSTDGVTWTCLGEQTAYESFPDNFNANAESSRFDFILPAGCAARYLAFACEKEAGSAILRQLLGEVQVFTEESSVQLGEPLPYTYTVDKASDTNHDSLPCPKLTDGTWQHVTRNGIRYLDATVTVSADLGAVRPVTGMELMTFQAKFNGQTTYYGTERVEISGSIDGQQWTPLADVFNDSVNRHAATFPRPTFVRYLTAAIHRKADTEERIHTAQFIGELTFFGQPPVVFGVEPEDTPGAIPFAGFETDPQLPPATQIMGGATNGWTFSYASNSNYTGFQINRSAVSYTNATTHYYAPEGVQTAVMRGTGSMETAFTAPQAGTYELDFLLNGTALPTASENGGYDFRVLIDGAAAATITVTRLVFTRHTILLHNLADGSHTLRFEGINSRNLSTGALIDDLRLRRFTFTADQLAQPAPGSVVALSSAVPLRLAYTGAQRVKELWMDGILQPPALYSSEDFPLALEGPGAFKHSHGTILTIQ